MAAAIIITESNSYQVRRVKEGGFIDSTMYSYEE